MDWNKLQRTLFELDPSDPREDLAKLQQAAQSGVSGTVAPAKDYLNESVEVPEGSLGLDKDYSIADFAALAGIKTNEGILDAPAVSSKWDAISHGFKNYNTPSALKVQVQGKDKFDRTSIDKEKSTKPLAQKTTSIDKLSKGDSFKDSKGMVWYYNPNEKNWRSKDRKQTISAERGFALWQKSASSRQRNKQESQIEALESRLAYLEDVIKTLIEGKKEMPKMPNPVAKNMNKFNKASVVPNKKKDVKDGKVKHKAKPAQYESIKDMLYAKLAEKK